mmetsp:Transcript_46866/g.108867  ORF Transcript_46866/g.108867 Transcript_46866/m.108867 type:complete len:151 (-) Transcript_46866:49-501(-)
MSVTVHVSGLDPEVEDNEVEAALEAALADADAPPSCSVRVMRNKGGKCRGYAFVSFDGPDEAAVALGVLNHALFPAAIGHVAAALSTPRARGHREPAPAHAAETQLPDLRLRKPRGPSRTKHPQSITCSDQRQKLDPRTGKLKPRDRTVA